MRHICSRLGGRIINDDGEVRSLCVDLTDLPIIMDDAEKKNLRIQLVEIAECSDFSPNDAIRMTIKYPNYSFCEWCDLDSADFSQIFGNSELFAEHVAERGFHNFDFYCQRILSQYEQDSFLHSGEYQLFISDDGLEKIILPGRNIVTEKAEFINGIKEKNSKVRTLDVGDIQIKSFKDTERKELGMFLIKFRKIKFLYSGREYSAEFNMNTQILKPDASSHDLAITTFEENENFDAKSYQPIEEAFWTDKLIPITDHLKSKIYNLR